MNGKRDFVLANTRLIAPPLTPEIRLRLADEAVPIWKKTEDELSAMGLPPPFWAFAWRAGRRSPAIRSTVPIWSKASGSSISLPAQG